jgi:copper homeostasis protein CutC
MEAIAKMVSLADGRITIMLGSGVITENVSQIVCQTSVKGVHSTCVILKRFPDLLNFNFIDTAPVRIIDRGTVDEMLHILGLLR